MPSGTPPIAWPEASRAVTGAASAPRSKLAGSDLYARSRLWSPTVSDIEAHITGTVWKIEVEVGDTVEEGDTVVILESMKMEMPVEAEDEGVVREIRVEEGQAVSEGDTLIVLE